MQPTEYITDNIIIGLGEVVAVRDRHGIKYALPGGGYIHDYREAVQLAKRLNSLVSYNMPRYNRSLFKK